MKKIIFLFLFLVHCFALKAQVSTGSSYIYIKDSLLQHLDKSRISTGALYDRVYQWAQLSEIDPEMPYTFALARQEWLE